MSERPADQQVVSQALSPADGGGQDLDLFGRPMPATSGPGRPKGARNRTSRELLRFLQASGADPHLHLARRMAADVQDLARELDCSVADAAAIQDRAAAALLPYVRSKAPVEISARTESLSVVIQADAPADPNAGRIGADSAAAAPLILEPLESEENQ